MPRVPLQLAVRETRAKLAEAEAITDWAAIETCIAELRGHADRAEREAGAVTEVVVMLRDLADETELEVRSYRGTA